MLRRSAAAGRGALFAGQFYWGKANSWLTGKVIFGADSVAVLLPRHRVQDIDTEEDWQRAEYLFRVISLETDARIASTQGAL